MELETDLENLQIPDPLLKRFYSSLTKKERKKIDSDKKEFKDYFEEFFFQILEDYQGKVVSEEIAEFIINFKLQNLPWNGGYPLRSEMSIISNSGEEYTVVSYGWSSDAEQDISMDMIAFKIRKRKD